VEQSAAELKALLNIANNEIARLNATIEGLTAELKAARKGIVLNPSNSENPTDSPPCK